MNQKNKLTWRYVLDNEAENARFYGHIMKFLPFVEKVGYKYFSWNGKVYELIVSNGSLGYKETEILIEDL